METPTPTPTPTSTSTVDALCGCFSAKNISGEERTISYTECNGLFNAAVPVPITTQNERITDCYLISGGISASGEGVVITICSDLSPCLYEGDCSTCGAIQDPTPTPTPTTEALGQCYTYTLVLADASDTDYGVRYRAVGTSVDSYSQFNGIASVQVSEGVYAYSVCSEIEPTLLDTSAWPVYNSIGSADGITRSGPDGNCVGNADCYTVPG
jgi:hypothetical protein